MATRPIVIYGDPVLREKTDPVREIDRETKNLVDDMIATLQEANGLGLAAPQVGVSKRIFVVDLSALDLVESLRVFINPEILETSGEVVLEEGCLSFPGIYQKISRPEKVGIRATDRNGNLFEMEASGMMARAILHEYDHLQGKLFIDYLSSVSRALLKGRLKKLGAASHK
ncbi:MAG: peptide deformylase [Candidatus Zixiibacteriota bacterium]|nr:MAG: peptide deformylase [candidate division Zixibacteria bacterium]